MVDWTISGKSGGKMTKNRILLHLPFINQTVSVSIMNWEK